MDIGLNLGSTPVNIPDYQIAGGGQGTALQQAGIGAAGTTGVGAGTQQAGIASSIYNNMLNKQRQGQILINFLIHINLM
jgi:hypothetical protein